MVLVSHEHGFVFLKTRKTAGTSVEMMLEPFCAPAGHRVTERTQAVVSPTGIVGTRLIPSARRRGESRRWYNHMPARRIRDGIGTDRFDRYLKITTARDPFERLVSLFHYQRARHAGRPLAGAWARLGPKNEDPRRVVAQFRKWLHRGKWKSDRDILFLDGRFLPDIVIRVESLRRDLGALATRLGITLDPAAIPVAKPGGAGRGRIPTASYFSGREIALVHEREPWVFDILSYPDTPAETEVAS